MTTIAYDPKEKKIAIDSRGCLGDMISTDSSQKWIEDETGIYFTSGVRPDSYALIEGIKAEAVQLESIKEFSATVLHVKDGSVYLYSFQDNNFIYHEEITNYEFRGFGSGGDWAVAANDFGSSVKDCVKYAITRDHYSGGKVSVYDVDSGRFIK